jgi:signal transduction histidine kinase
MRALREQAARLGPIRVDLIFAVAMIVELELEAWLNRGIPDSQRLVTAVASVFYAAPIAFRRRSPSFALLFCLSVAVIQTIFAGALLQNLGGDTVPVLVLSYSVGAWLDSRRSVRTLLLACCLLGANEFLPFDGGPPSGLGDIAYVLFYASMLIFPAWFAGRLVRERRRRASAFRELAAQAAAEQAQHESAAIAEERARIGSELQDIIAHSVSAMVIQAGGARQFLSSDPDRARDSILNVEHTGREALADLRRLLGMLRKDDDPRALAPQPGLDRLPALIDAIHATGLACELRTLGEQIDLTPGVDLVAYRVIEAALLSAAHHRCSRTVVTVRYEPHELELEIDGDGSNADLDDHLRAIAQRVSLYDGSLSLPPGGGDGFSVQARLPLGAAVPA